MKPKFFNLDCMQLVIGYLPDRKKLSMQELHSRFYTDLVPNEIQNFTSDYGMTVDKLKMMLRTPPPNISSKMLKQSGARNRENQ